jgi:AraC family transcriptional regulator of adaptative response/methylated-DNA-[protein]-cysteine methyltransferase
MSDMKQRCRDYERVEAAIAYLQDHAGRQPSLSEVSGSLGMSEYHFHRLFSRWVGISPKRFLQFLTKEHAKKLIDGSETLLDAADGAGLSGTGRLHDLFVSCEAVTPGEYKRRGAGLDIAYGIHPSPFGPCLIGVTSRGVCSLGFRSTAGADEAGRRLSAHWPEASFRWDPEGTKSVSRAVFPDDRSGPPRPLHLFVRGTNFQIKVWEALLRIPMGKAVSYEDIARHIGRPKAARAVGNAVGANPLPFLIPCHRVIRKTGDFGYYGEGPTRKKAILGWEAATA